MLSAINLRWCTVRVENDQWDMPCPNPMTSKWLQPIGEPSADPRQYFLAQCQNGTERWIEVNDSLFESETIRLGTVNHHGQVIQSELN